MLFDFTPTAPSTGVSSKMIDEKMLELLAGNRLILFLSPFRFSFFCLCSEVFIFQFSPIHGGGDFVP
jgi:hypothetical protein